MTQSPLVRTLRVVLGVAVLAALVLAWRFLPLAQWLVSFQQFVRGLGPAGYVVYALAYVVSCVLVIPALALTLGAGAIFGFAKGTIVVTVGATMGACAAFFVARSALRHRVAALAARHAKLGAIDRAIAAEGTKLMLLMRVSGFPPFTWINYGLGLTAVPFRTYFWTTLFGMLPGVIVFTYAGAAGAAALTGSGSRTAMIVTAVGAVLVMAYVARIAVRAVHRAGV